MSYLTSEMQQILSRVEQETGDTALVQSIHFSPTALTFIRRLTMGGGTIITDTMLSLSAADSKLLKQHSLEITCFIDDPNVISAAEKKARNKGRDRGGSRDDPPGNEALCRR